MEKEDKKEECSNLKPFQYIKVTQYSPLVKRQITKCFNLLKMSLDEAKEEARKWKENNRIYFDEEMKRQNEPKKTDITPFEIKLDPYSGLSFLMIGSTRSGKSTALNWLMDNYFFKKEEKFINVLFSNSYQAPV
jgi:ABC-type transport system involved in cytochrome bd biosynthesis fused ATPase/permease subunit